MNLQMTIFLVLLMSEVTMFVVFIGIAITGGGVLMTFTANKTSSVRQSLAPNKDLLNEKKAELLEFELKPRPSKVIVNSRKKDFDIILENLDLEKMSDNNKIKSLKYNDNEIVEEKSKSQIKIPTKKKSSESKIKKDISKIDAIINTK